MYLSQGSPSLVINVSFINEKVISYRQQDKVHLKHPTTCIASLWTSHQQVRNNLLTNLNMIDRNIRLVTTSAHSCNNIVTVYITVLLLEQPCNKSDIVLSSLLQDVNSLFLTCYNNLYRTTNLSTNLSLLQLVCRFVTTYAFLHV